MKESKFQADLITDIYGRWPEAVVLKNDPNYRQGIPDLLVLYQDKWAALECKAHEKSSHRPNQDYYVKKLNSMSFASFISPETKEAILNDLQQAFGA